MLERFDLTIADVVEATGLTYDFVHSALHDGSLEGIVAPRYLRTNEQAVSAWLDSLKVKKTKAIVAAPQTKPRKQRGRAQAQAFRHVDPSRFGKRK